MDPERTDRVAGSLAWRYRREPLLPILSMFLSPTDSFIVITGMDTTMDAPFPVVWNPYS